MAATTAEGVQSRKYSAKELDRENGLDMYDFHARMLMSDLGRTTTIDPLAGKYYSISPYAWCAGNPVKYVDPNGRLLVFINGFQINPFENSKDYWGDFDDNVANHFNDNKNPYYFDGALGCWGAILGGKDSNMNPNVRYYCGYAIGKMNASQIIKCLKRDENGLIIEPLRIVTHSMGAAYGKGFVQAIIDFAKKNQKITNGLIVSEYDFAPFQPGSQKSVNGVTTYQDSHTDDKIAGFQKINGATPIKQSNKKRRTFN